MKEKLSITNNIGKKLETILRTFKQSPDADILLTSTIALGYFKGFGNLAIGAGILALKQYVWGHRSYFQTRKYIQRYLDRGKEVNEKAIKKVLYSPCDYFGSRYALREFRKNKVGVK